MWKAAFTTQPAVYVNIWFKGKYSSGLKPKNIQFTATQNTEKQQIQDGTR